jgi:hypothetical protein
LLSAEAASTPRIGGSRKRKASGAIVRRRRDFLEFLSPDDPNFKIKMESHWLRNGSIERVFEASAAFWEELASRAFELQAAERLPDGSNDKGKSVREPLADEPLDSMPPRSMGTPPSSVLASV